MDQTPNEIMTDISRVEAVIATARRLLTEGKMIDLAALEGKVSEICVTIANLDNGEAARPLLPVLEGLMENLDALARDLESQHGELTLLGPEEETTPQAAAQAYTAPHNKDTD